MMKSGSYKVAAVLIIASFIIPCRFDDSLNTGPSSDNIFDEHTKVQLQKSTYPLNENSLVDLKREKNDTDIMLDRKVNPMKVVETANMVLGFVTGFMSIFDFIKGKTDGKDKHSLDDVMATLDREFNSINVQLNAIFDGVNNLQIATYKDVEITVRNAMTAMKYNLPVENDRDANILYTKLHLLMDGMLGNSAVLPNLIKVVADKNNCNYKDVYQHMDKIINLVNIGGAGLSYYYAKLQKTSTALERIESLSKKKDMVEERVEAVRSDCIQPSVIDTKIEKIIKSMQSAKPCEVTDALQKSFSKEYDYAIWNWYAVWNFNPSGSTSIATRRIAGGGSSGMSESGGWKVYWTAQFKPEGWASMDHLKVDENCIVNAFNRRGPGRTSNEINFATASTILYSSRRFFGCISGRNSLTWVAAKNSVRQWYCGGGNDIFFKRFSIYNFEMDLLIN